MGEISKEGYPNMGHNNFTTQAQIRSLLIPTTVSKNSAITLTLLKHPQVAQV